MTAGRDSFGGLVQFPGNRDTKRRKQYWTTRTDSFYVWHARCYRDSQNGDDMKPLRLDITTDLELDWEPETLSLLSTLQQHGFQITAVEDGEETLEVSESTAVFDVVRFLTAVDVSHLTVRAPTGGRVFGVCVVLGNAPGEIAANWTSDDSLDCAILQHVDRWECQGQPKCYRVRATILQTGKILGRSSRKFTSRSKASDYRRKLETAFAAIVEVHSTAEEILWILDTIGKAK